MSLETPPSPQEEFLQYTKNLISPYLEEKKGYTTDTDSVFGKITGELDTSPRSYLEVSFDTTKDNLDSVIENAITEKLLALKIDGSTTFKTLNIELNIAPESEKDKPVDERDAIGGSSSLI